MSVELICIHCKEPYRDTRKRIYPECRVCKAELDKGVIPTANMITGDHGLRGSYVSQRHGEPSPWAENCTRAREG